MSAPFPFQPQSTPAAAGQRRIALICAKGGLDECYPVLIMANAARMSGIDTSVFFTFYGLDVITTSRVDHLHVNMVGNPAAPIPPALAGFPGHGVTDHERSCGKQDGPARSSAGA